MIAFAPRLRRALIPCLLLACWGMPPAHAQPVTQPFTFSLVGHTMPHLSHMVVALGDYDNDGDLDVLLTGILGKNIVAGLYRNEGSNVRDGTPTFIFERTQTAISALAYGAAAWGDYDGDDDLDLVVTGSRTIDPPYETEAVLYRNDGGELVATDVPLAGSHSGAAAWGDFDNDGDLDLLLGGEGDGRVSETRLYRNDRGAFVEWDAGLPGLAYGDAAWGDADGDGDLDLAMDGLSEDGIYADIFRNDAGAFSRIESPLLPAAFTEINWGDFDGDGDLDIVQTGGQFSDKIIEGVTRIYRNTNPGFEPFEFDGTGGIAGAATWGDYDNDGDLDLLVMGVADDLFGRRLARIYANEGSDYTDKIHFIGAVFASAAWGDLDADGDLDLLSAGHPTVGNPFINIYENKRQVMNPPQAPAKLVSDVSPGSVTLRWSPPAAAASNNLRVGSMPNLGDVVAPMSDASTGRRLIPAPGNAQQNSSWRLHGLAPGTYYWSVQAVDQAFTASSFAPEQQFTIAEATSAEEPADMLPVETALHPAAPNPSSGPVTLHYDVAQRSAVMIRIYDLLGRTVAVPVNQEQDRGRHSVRWDGRDLRGVSVASGMYICELQSGFHRQTIRLVVTR